MTKSHNQIKKWLLKKNFLEEDMLITPGIPDAIKVSLEDSIAPLYVLSQSANIQECRVHIWNENHAEAIYIWDGDESGQLIDAKVPPTQEMDKNLKQLICPFPTRDELHSSAFWANYADQYISKKRKPVDIHLVEALKSLLENLHQANLNDPTAHGLIDRCLFASFLDHRNLWYQKLSLAEALSNKSIKQVKYIFDELAKRFNGDLARAPLPSKLNVDLLSTLSDVFGLNPYHENQGMFFSYRFDLINVDLISSIFEKFIETTSRWTNNQSGTHYSPPQIAWRVVEQTMKPIVDLCNENELKALKIIDPCCGSGIFLVHAYRYLKMAINERREKNKKPPLNHKDSVKLMLKSIRGWDIEPTAIRIASFGLMLSLLDGYKKIPQNFKFPSFIDNILIVRDGLLNGSIQYDNTKNTHYLYPPDTPYTELDTYNFVVGNPPWGFKNFSTQYKNELKSIYPQPNKGSSSEAFAMKFIELAGKNGRVGMMLNSSVWVNRTSDFRFCIERLNRLDTVIELGGVHKILGYSTSGENTSILIFKKEPSENNYDTNKIFDKKENLNKTTYISPTITPFSNLLKVVLISTEQYKTFELAKLNKLENKYGINSLALLKVDLKQQKLIQKILNNFENNHFIDAQKGGQIKKGSNIQNPFKARYLSNLSYANGKYAKIKPDNLRRSAIKAQEYSVLLRRHEVKGRLQVSVKDDDFTVLDDVIAMESEFINKYALAGLFTSKLSYYILRFLARQFGQRQQSYLDDTAIKFFPVPDVNKLSNKKIIKALKKIVQKIIITQGKSSLKLINHDNLTPYLNTIDELVYELYDLTYLDRLLVDDFFLKETGNPSFNEAIQNYNEIFKELTGVSTTYHNSQFGSMIYSFSNAEKSSQIPYAAIPSVLAGDAYYLWDNDKFTIYRSMNANLWDISSSITDSDRFNAHTTAKSIRKTA